MPAKDRKNIGQIDLPHELHGRIERWRGRHPNITYKAFAMAGIRALLAFDESVTAILIAGDPSHRDYQKSIWIINRAVTLAERTYAAIWDEIDAKMQAETQGTPDANRVVDQSREAAGTIRPPETNRRKTPGRP